MRGRRRHGDEHGLDEERRGLIHRYMTDADEPAEEPAEPALESPPKQSEESELSAPVTGISAAPLEEVEQPFEPSVAVEAEAPADRAPAEALLRLLPPVSDREASFQASRRTLEQVSRLCVQVDWVRVECNRRRERLAATAARPPMSPNFPTK